MLDGYSKWNNDVAFREKPILMKQRGLSGNFIDNARTEKEGHENVGHEQSGYEVLGDDGSGGGVRGKELYSGSVHNEKLGAIPQSSEGDTAPVVRSSLGQLPAAGDHGDEHRGSAGAGQKLDMTGADRNEVSLIIRSINCRVIKRKKTQERQMYQR